MTPADLLKHEESVNELLSRLRRFLMTPDHGDGESWPDISREQVREVRALTEDLMSLKWGKDCDGDAPVKTLVWFRCTHYLPCAFLLRQLFQDEGNRAFQNEVLLNNIRLAQSGIEAYASTVRAACNQLSDIALEDRREAAKLPLFKATWSPGGEVSFHRSELEARSYGAANELYSGSVLPIWVWPLPSQPDDTFEEFPAHVAKALNTPMSVREALAVFSTSSREVV
jgi:hypothetical protein